MKSAYRGLRPAHTGTRGSELIRGDRKVIDKHKGNLLYSRYPLTAKETPTFTTESTKGMECFVR